MTWYWWLIAWCGASVIVGPLAGRLLRAAREADEAAARIIEP